jgi:hypothetical protein
LLSFGGDLGPEHSAMALAPLQTFQTARQDYAARQARRRELQALARAGERIASHAQAAIAGDQGGLMARIRPLREQIAELTAEIERSRAKDRADYAAVSPGVRPLVVGRGFCERMVLRHLRARSRQRLEPLYQQLGATTVITPASASAFVPAVYSVPAVHSAATHTAAVHSAATPTGAVDSASPSAPLSIDRSSGVAKEGVAFAITFVKQLQTTLIPRAPALAGLVVGWWIARTYTDSRWRSLLHRVGIGDGGTRVVSSETLQAMSFWLPILAAAICAYAGDRIARWFRRRYETSAG